MFQRVIGNARGVVVFGAGRGSPKEIALAAGRFLKACVAICRYSTKN
jgi:hypothetical protein